MSVHSSPNYTILVTGASRGIGLEFVRQYAEQAKSDPERKIRVIATARDPSSAGGLKQLAEKSDAVTVEQLDVSSPESIAKLAAKLRQEGVTIQELINNAAINRDGDDLAHLSEKVLQELYQTNTIGPLFVIKELRPLLKDYSSSVPARIVNISSSLGSTTLLSSGALPFTNQWLSYSLTKAALNNALPTLVSQLPGVLIFNLCPGAVKTDMGSKVGVLEVDDSVGRLRKIIAKATWDENGKFFNHEDKPVPW